MEISGEVIALLPAVEGQGKNGTWRKQEFILEIPGQYTKKVCIEMWGDKISEWDLKPGDKATAHIDIESKEYNSRWYTAVKTWKVEKQGSATEPYHENRSSAPAPPVSNFDDSEDSGLPF